ncbi:hypothetical protein B7P43_G10479 [Cryptotermes secundus]|uniref:Odorant receptor n=1 Tax=Cryptotermes secundus TaxID=105785 RepID=A0A2J7QKZ6_9NEOP|nr:hypothetical protein B7P43_G10479 [Cryptotermes secundus]
MEELSLNLQLLALSGIVEPPFVSGSLWKRSLFSLYMVTSVLVFIPVLLGELLALYHFWGDLVVITNNVFTLVGNLTFYGEALYIIARRGEFMMLMKKLQDMLEHMPRPGAEQKMIAEKATKRSRVLTWSMLVMVYMVPFSWSMSPLVGMLFSNGEDIPEKSVLLEDEVEAFWKSLISVMWLPLHDIESPVKEIIYVCQVFVFLITATYYISVNTVFVSFIVQTTGQFEILLATVHEMDDAVASWDLAPPGVTGDSTDTVLVDVFGSKETKTMALRWLHRSDDPSKLRSYFLDVIRHHQAIIGKLRLVVTNYSNVGVFVSPNVAVSTVEPAIPCKLRFACEEHVIQEVGLMSTLVQYPLTKLNSRYEVSWTYVVYSRWMIRIKLLAVQDPPNT